MKRDAEIAMDLLERVESLTAALDKAEAERDALRGQCEALEWLIEINEVDGWLMDRMSEAGLKTFRAIRKAALAATEVKP